MTADLALAADPGFLERSADPAEFVIQACERAKVWLAEALEHGDLDQIVEVKSQAEAIRVYTMQKNLGKDAVLSARKVVLRAERCIGLAIRRGQEAGEIVKHGGPKKSGHVDNGSTPRPVTDFVSHDVLTGNNAGIYDMTDGVSNEQFDAAIEEAEAEENLSRANVVRKIRSRSRPEEPGEWIPDPGDRHGEAPVQRRKLIRAWAGRNYSSRQMGELLGMNSEVVRRIAREISVEITADQFVVGTRRHDSNRIVRETVQTLEGLAMGISLVDMDDLDQGELSAWTSSLSNSIRALNRLAKQMKEVVQA